MENFALEIAEEEIEKKSARCRELDEKRRGLLSRIEKAEAARQSVSERIYLKVKGEYERELRSVENALEPIVHELEQSRAAADQRLREVSSRVEELRDSLEELEFRRLVGEMDDASLDRARTPLDQEIERLEDRRRDLADILNHIRTLGSAPRSHERSSERPVENPREDPVARKIPPPAAPLDPDREPVPAAVEDAADERHPEPTDTPPVSATPHVDSPADPFPAETDLSAPAASDPPVDATGAPSEERGGPEEFVDVSEWLGEFSLDETAGDAPDAGDPGPVASSPHSPAEQPQGNAAQASPGEDLDPLAHLADPCDESSDGDSDVSARSAAPVRTGIPILSVKSGPGAGKRLPLLPVSMTIGREVDNNIELKDKDVARYHARISYESGRHVIEDVEGSSGTFVNGKKITRTALNPGDVIRVGGTELSMDLG